LERHAIQHFTKKLAVADEKCLPLSSYKFLSMGREDSSHDSQMFQNAMGRKTPWHFFCRKFASKVLSSDGNAIFD
jgi:hypothetical protein